MNSCDRSECRRILVINHNYVSPGEVGSNRSHYIVQTCLAAGYAVDLIRARQSYLGNPDAAEAASLAHDFPQHAALNIYRVGQALRAGQRSSRVASYVSFVAQTLTLMRRLPRPDLVLVTTPPLPQVVGGFAAAAWHRAPLLLEITDIWPAAVQETGQLRGRLVGLVMSFLEQLSYRLADHCVVASPMILPYLTNLGIPPSQCSSVPTGAVLCARDTEAGTAWRERNELKGRFLMLYCGSFNAAYGIERLVDAARLTAKCAPHVTWLFAGSGTGREALERAAREAQNIRFLGALPRESLARVLAAADAGIVSLCTEHRLSHSAESSKLIECLGCGLPVICLIDGFPGAMVRAAGAGIVAPARTAQEIADAVLQLAGVEREKLVSIGLAGQTWASACWNQESFSGRLVDLLARRLVVGRVPRRAWLKRLALAFWPAISVIARGKPAKAVSYYLGFDRPPADAFLASWLYRSGSAGHATAPPVSR